MWVIRVAVLVMMPFYVFIIYICGVYYRYQEIHPIDMKDCNSLYKAYDVDVNELEMQLRVVIA